jgi:uncharacterized protein (DUF4415 family)
MATRFNKARAEAMGYTKADWDEVSDNPILTKERLAQLKTFVEAFPDLAESIRRARGRPKLDNAKKAVTLRIDPATLERFQARGKDWRAKMSEALDKAVR